MRAPFRDHPAPGKAPPLHLVLAGGAGGHGGALGLDLPGPLGDGLRIGSGVEGGLVAGEPGVAVGDEGLGVLAGRPQHSGTWVLGGMHLADGLLEPVYDLNSV